MTAIEIFEKQVEIWNQNQFCNNCWVFSAPLSEEAMNAYQLRSEEECCYHLFVVDYSSSTRNIYNSSNYLTQKTCEERFTIYIAKSDRIDINNYNEIEEHPIDQSKWETIIKPLIECFTCDMMIDDCDILGYPVMIPEWNVSKVINLHDNNYTGIKITGLFRRIL